MSWTHWNFWKHYLMEFWRDDGVDYNLMSDGTYFQIPAL